MALYLAKTPRYRSQQGVPRQIGGRYADLRPSTAENQAIRRLGSLLVERAEELKKERDAAVVGDLYNNWRDSERNVLTELSSRQGKDAKDLYKDYDKFYNKSLGELDIASENGTQQTAIKEMLGRRRQQSLDGLASYEAQEGKRYKAQEQKGVIANKEADARAAGFDDVQFENARIEVFDYITNANPGMSEEALTALLEATESQLTFANMQAKIEIDPDRALGEIEKWKDVLGEGYSSLKDSAAKASKDKLVETLRDGLNFRHTQGLTPDFNGMEDDIHNDPDVPDEIKDQVISWLRSQEREFEAREKKVKDDTQDTEMDLIFEFIRKEDYTSAYKSVLESTQLSEVQKFRVENIIKSAEGSETDATAYNDIIIKAMRAEATRDEIINLIGNGLSGDDARTVLIELKKAEQPGRERINKLTSEAADTIEKQLLKGSVLSGFTPLSRKKAYEGVRDFQQTIGNLPKDVTIEEALNPQSPNYIIDDIVSRNTPTYQEETNAMVESLNIGPGNIRRKPGESIEDFEKRNQ